MSCLLLLNPNTSPGISARLLALAQQQVPNGVNLQVATARLGAAYIGSEAGAAIAAHAALDACAAHLQAHGPPDAVLLACFGDPGLHALRALAGVPVIGLAESSMHAAAGLGPFVVLTGGPAWVPMLERFARTLDLAQPLLGVQALPVQGAALAADPAGAALQLAQAARQALSRWPQARSVLLGGAGLAGLAPALQAAVPVPVLCNLQLALRTALAAVQSAPPVSPKAPPEPGLWQGLSDELSSLLCRGAPEGAAARP